MLQQKSGGRRRYTFDEVAVIYAVEEKEGAAWNAMENAYIRGVWEYFPVRDWRRRSFERMPRKKSRKEYKANGKANRLPKNTWNK